MSEPLETIMELREELMVSPVGDSITTLRTAHFLKPSVTTIEGPVSNIPSSSLSSLPSTFEPRKWPLTVKFNGWRFPPQKWILWVDSLHSTYESLWKEVGIYEAIMSTKYDLLKNEELVFGIAERWCSKTNTFVFPWAEATITLEDMMVLGGYPVLGASVFSPLETQELKEIEEKLLLARMEITRRKYSKASINAWMNLFINSGREIEHEAFLATWLSRFVFPENTLVRKLVFPIAIHLARGNAIALAPAVLANIYKDLTLLKETIVYLTKNPVHGDEEHLELFLRSPFYLVQIWVWERMEALQPKPKLINHGDPVLARWHRVRALEIDSVRVVLDSAGEEFLWRPYARFSGKRRTFYVEHSMWVPSDHTLDKELRSFVICLRVSELVGLDCIKQYLPHRVAMQFGMDQDLPGCVARVNETPEIAWSNYCRPIVDSNLLIPSRFFEADVTTRYVEWWKQSVLGHQDPVKNMVQGKRSPRSSKHGSQASKAKRGKDADGPPGFPPKCSNAFIFGNSCDVPPKRMKTVSSGDSADNIADIPPGFPSKITLTPGNSVKGCKPTIMEDKCGGMSYCLGKVTTCECNQSQSSFASTADYGTVRKMDSKMKPLAKVKSEPSMGGLEEAREDADVPRGFPPKCSNALIFGNSCDVLPKRLKNVISGDSAEKFSRATGDNNADVPAVFPPKIRVSPENSVKECEPTILEDECDGMSYSLGKVTTCECNQSLSSFASTSDYETVRKMDLEVKPVAKVKSETSMGGLEEAIEDAHGREELSLAYDRVYLSWTEGEGNSYMPDIKVMDLEKRISRLERVVAELKIARFSQSLPTNRNMMNP